MWLRRGLIGVAVFVGGYFAIAEGLMRLSIHADADPLAGTVEVYLVSNGVHVDVWVPAVSPEQDWASWLPREAGFGRPGMLAFGWGERAFYLEVPDWSDLTPGIALRAVLWPTRTAMHVTAYSGRPLKHAQVHLLRVSTDGYRELVDYIKQGFELDPAGRPVLLDHPGYAAQNPEKNMAPDRFFAGRGSYSLFRTCNTWTNGAVKAMGKRAAVWTPFERGARHHLPSNQGRAE